MNDKEFNFYRLWLFEKHVVLLALKDVFELLWNKKYPKTPWESDYESVKLFEAKVKETSDKKKKQRDRILSDSNWNNYQWDTNKMVYALVDSRIFDTEISVFDDEGKPVSEHITDMRDFRNEIAHLTSCSYETDTFLALLDEMTEHIKALEYFQLENFDVFIYLDKIQDIRSQTRPELQEFYKEKERMDAFIKQIEADKAKILEEYQKLDAEKQFLIDTIKTLCVRKSSELEAEEADEDGYKHNSDMKYENLHSDIDHLTKVATDMKNKETVEIIQLKAENEYMEKVKEGINRKHYIEIDRHKSENKLLKEILAHSAELSQLKHTLRDLDKQLKEALEENDKFQSENKDLRDLVERLRKENCRPTLWRCSKNVIVLQILCILMAITILKTIKARTKM